MGGRDLRQGVGKSAGRDFEAAPSQRSTNWSNLGFSLSTLRSRFPTAYRKHPFHLEAERLKSAGCGETYHVSINTTKSSYRYLILQIRAKDYRSALI
jgi:hypothetical protein